MNPQSLHRQALSAWTAELQTVFPQFSGPQVKVLAQYSWGMCLCQRCGLSCVSFALSRCLGQSESTVRERLRDWYCSAKDKSGQHRRPLPLSDGFGPMLAWVLRCWEGRQLALALDATTLGQRFTVLAISVLYRGLAIPVAWKILPATAPGPGSRSGWPCSGTLSNGCRRGCR